MFSSKKDLEGAIAVVLVALLIIIIFYLLGIRVHFTDLQKAFNDQTLHAFYQGTIYLLFPLGLDLGLIIILTISNRLLSR